MEGDKPAEHVDIVDAAMADDDKLVSHAVVERDSTDTVALSPTQAEAVQQVEITMAALEATIESLRSIGCLRGVQSIEAELQKERRKQRQLIKATPAVADAFLQRRRAEDQDTLTRKRLAAQQQQLERDRAKAIADRNAAAAELRQHKRSIQDMEGLRACKHAIKTFTPDALGQGSRNAGGTKAKSRRFEVLDRLARLKAGLSPGQKNDWQWFKESWDQAMVHEHKDNWASVFAGRVQTVLNDDRSNALSLFVYSETCRVFNATVALHVPGS